jgi:uncharacterized protein YdeI (YjbR/CyaY-like superfamily)
VQELKSGLPVLAFSHETAFERWLRAHRDATGLWIKFAKKGKGSVSVTKQQALDVALCYGWIDGLAASYDEAYFLMRFTPRRPRSGWSQVNCARAETLIAEGRMRPAGLAQIHAAKSDGRWEAAYPPPSKAAVPDDLQEALAANPKAAASFQSLSKSRRYMMLHGIATVRRADTRARKIGELITMLSMPAEWIKKR